MGIHKYGMNNNIDMCLEFLEWFSLNNKGFDNFADLHIFYALYRKKIIQTDWHFIPYLVSRIDKFNYSSQRKERSLEDIAVVQLLIENNLYPLENMELDLTLKDTVDDPYRWCFWNLIYGNVSNPTRLQKNIENELKNLDLNNYFQVRLAQLINVGNNLIIPPYSELTFHQILDAPYKIFLFDKTNQRLSDKIQTPLMFNITDGDDLFLRFNDSILSIQDKVLSFHDINQVAELTDKNVIRMNMFAFVKEGSENVYYKFYRNSGGLTVAIFSRNAEKIKDRLKSISTYYVDSNINFNDNNLIATNNLYWALIWKTNHANIQIPKEERITSPDVSDLIYKHNIVRINTAEKTMIMV